MNKNMKAVVVTTGEHRGVFFGYVEDNILPENKIVTIKNARMCVYWSEDVHGIVGLASGGPTALCKITPAAQEITLSDVNSIMLCSDTASRAWEAEPWS